MPRNSLNGFRFRVLYFRGTNYKVPSRIRVAKKGVSLRYLDEPGISSDFIECLIYNVYGLGQRLRQVRTILDIGANVGFFSLAAKEYYPDAIIHAYEPNPRVQKLLRANVEGLNIEVYPEAVGGQAGQVTLSDESVSNMARTCPSQDAKGGIAQIRLDAAVERIGGAVDLLKMDCEGAEWEMFGLADSWDSIKNVRMEYHLYRGESVEQVMQTLSGLGFRITRLGPQRNDMGIIWGSRD
ncbi:MAG: FkbM family methyltransferase [Terracidiphilus sp.]